MLKAVLSGRGDEIVGLAKVNLFRRPEMTATVVLFGGAIGRKPSMFRPQRHDRESNDDSD
jgi:hypothetical protein